MEDISAVISISDGKESLTALKVNREFFGLKIVSFFSCKRTTFPFVQNDKTSPVSAE